MIVLFVLLAILSFSLIFVVLPLILAIRETIIKGKQFNSKLYSGRVWHTRFQPKRHSFTYPIFLFAIDLDEDLEDFFSPILKFRESDHLKNREGLSSERTNNSLKARILRLISIRTKGKCQPTLESHKVVLLTHLCYYGYNFNPVSFYYVIDKKTNELTTMVAEVSNTPWEEMFPYVLHPDSIDKVDYQKKKYGEVFNFPKVFHVSPFMEMDYMYSFIFKGVPTLGDNQEDPSCPITVINNLHQLSDNRLNFSAKLEVSAQPITPFRVAWQLIRFPVFCVILQIWIHYQAAWLFIKGIAFVPHPEGSETRVTQAIASLMVPFFAIRDRMGVGIREKDKIVGQSNKVE